MFQSPSLRGSGRFRLPPPKGGGEPFGFNPLHCGAVVASITPQGGLGGRTAFQSPSLRGSGRFRRSGDDRPRLAAGFNPLHCGAVVASPPRLPQAGGVSEKFQSPSLRGSGRFSRGASPRVSSSRFNPLHCGAVVASERTGRNRRPGDRVSIPFIAGQWSLRTLGIQDGRVLEARFNPLHCGAVVASTYGLCWAIAREKSFNPLHCGAVVASPIASHLGGNPPLVSIPVIAGQWSLLVAAVALVVAAARFQSPSLRGSGRFFCKPASPQGGGASFNPLHCGAVVASVRCASANV